MASIKTVPSSLNINDLVDCKDAVGWSGCARVVEGPMVGCPDLVWIQEVVRLDGDPYRFRGLWPKDKLTKVS